MWNHYYFACVISFYVWIFHFILWNNYYFVLMALSSGGHFGSSFLLWVPAPSLRAGPLELDLKVTEKALLLGAEQFRSSLYLLMNVRKPVVTTLSTCCNGRGHMYVHLCGKLEKNEFGLWLLEWQFLHDIFSLLHVLSAWSFWKFLRRIGNVLCGILNRISLLCYLLLDFFSVRF